jgi:hypothetical protein
METIETENGWTIRGTLTSETDRQIGIRVKHAAHGGQDCTDRVRPNMFISKDNVKARY